jgi:peptidoglycan glycosyltransferase
MNRPIVRVFALVIVLFAVLVGFTSRWTVFESASLRSNALNRRGLLEQERIARGRIVASDGSLLAHSLRSPEGTYQRKYPTGELFAHAVGYYYTDLGDAGLERYRNNTLSGHSETGFQTILDQLQGKQPQGNDVVSTLNPGAQRTAVAALEGHRGAVVAIEPSTGAIRVMASAPSFDPNSLASPHTYTRLAREGLGSPLVNRATQFGYAPGSTFKVVTATAALDSGMFTPTSTVSGSNGAVVSGVPLHNDNNENFGQITLTEALTKSVDTAWARVAEQVGKATLGRYMARFGFDHKPALDYPAEQMSSSGEYEGGRLLAPTDQRVDVGRMGIGQDKLRVTPLQMAEVAAAVANHGKLMTPHMTERIVDPEGRTVETIKPHVQSVVMKPSTAAALTEMMEAVVREGTGTPAQIPGVAVAGKTGTAETQFGSAINNVWFIAFAPAGAPRIAVAVAVEKVPGFGATYAAPVAKQVMEALLK